MTLFEAENSIYTEKLILVLEYAQLVSQILIVCCNKFSSNDTSSELIEDKKLLFDWITYFFKLTNPSFLMHFKGSNTTTAIILSIVLVCVLLKFVLFGYIVYLAYSKNTREILC